MLIWSPIVMSWSVVESRTLSEEPQVSLSDEVRYSTMKELNSLNEEVISLKKRSLHCTKNFSRAVSTCHIYICPFLPTTSETDLSSIINFPTLNATKLGFSWKVKIHETVCTWSNIFSLSTLALCSHLEEQY